MIKTKYMFSEAKAKAKDTTSEAQGQGQGLGPQGQGHDQLSSRRLEAKAMASRTPSLVGRLWNFPPVTAGLHITDNNGDQLSGIAKLELPERADLSMSLWYYVK